MTALQRFKENDLTEKKYIDAMMPALTGIGASLDEFWEDAYECYLLGDVLYELGRDPMSGVITQDIYRQSFPAIHQLFTRPGTFEFYLTVFRSIWGDAVDVTFAIPSPGVLTINAEVLDIGTFDFVAREIVDNAYQYNPVVDEASDFIQFRDTVGIKNQSEIDALMNELSPEGVIVITTLTV